jgi:hypothetical protein
MQSTIAQHVGGPRRDGRVQAIRDSKLTAQGYSGWFLHEDGIGTRVDRPPAEALGEDHAAGPAGRFEDANCNAALL